MKWPCYALSGLMALPLFAQPAEVPLGGNSYVQGGPEHLPDLQGLRSWTDPQVRVQTYVYINAPGSLSVGLKTARAQGRLRLSINGESREVDFSGKPAGPWQIRQAGYVKIELQNPEGKALAARPEALLLSGTALAKGSHFVPSNEGNFYYWGRRGPSVHLNYVLPEQTDLSAFYSELTVPAGQDVVGSYFMANGFAEGYFGIQVNSPTERRVLFSVWSPYQTDRPEDIPANQRIELLRKGPQVHAGAFGNEGSGGQSYLVFPWKAGNTYRFLLQARPDTARQSTVFTAWFFAPETSNWQLVAAFRRPQTFTWLKRLHAFLENFIPENGDKTRYALYGNQWAADTHGHWHELNAARFSADNTARKGYRLDYAGGLRQGQFFMQNGGFFNGTTAIGSTFVRPGGGRQPAVDTAKLP